MSDWHRRVELLYQGALDEPPERRREFVRSGSHGDDALQREVEELLQCYEAAVGNFLNDPAHRLKAITDAAAALPERIARYRILEKIGEGGMGTVYRAEQDNPRREVALKVVRPGITRAESLRRFEMEAAILGRLRHPGIAQIHEAGMEDGPGGPRPYFAMELIEGSPLKTFVQRRQLDTQARLELFALVCDAVHYAHQKGVIHRDLKPANILVVEGDAEHADSVRGSHRGFGPPPVLNAKRQGFLRAFPKILDFGIARVTDSDLQATTMHTHAGQVVGTLPYMSPEQVGGDIGDVDTRSDVYALGVILYELLSGRVPFDVADKSIASAARTISEVEPVPLSTIDRALRGDLNTIVLTCLEKQPQRRYPSASDLAADLRRFLEQRPISARPASTMYQLRKFARRNKGTVIGLAAAVVILVGGLIGTSYGLAQAVRARTVAEKSEQAAIAARNDAQAVTEFLAQMLRDVSPQSRQDNATVQDVLDRAATTLGQQFLGRPYVEAEVRYALGWSYASQGLLDQARTHLAEAAALYHRAKGERAPETLKALTSLAIVLSEKGEHNKSEAQTKANLEVQRRVLGEEDGRTLLTMVALARALMDQGRYAEAEPLLRKAGQAQCRQRGDEHIETLETMNVLGLALYFQGRYAEAEKLHRQTLEIRQRVFGEEHSTTRSSRHNLANAVNAQGRFAEAEELHRRNLAENRRLLGDEHRRTLVSLDDLARNLCDQYRFAEAEAMSRQALEGLRRTFGKNHPDTLEAMQNLAIAVQHQGRFSEAEGLHQAAFEEYRRLWGVEHPVTLIAMVNLGWVYADGGPINKAEPLLREALEANNRLLGPDHPATIKSMDAWGALLAKLDRVVEAESSIKDTIERSERVLGPEHPQTRRARERLANLYVLKKRLNETEPRP